MLEQGRRVRKGWSLRRVATLVVAALVYFAVLAFVVEVLHPDSRLEARAMLSALAIPGIFVGALPDLLRPQSAGRRKRKRSWKRTRATEVSGRTPTG